MIEQSLPPAANSLLPRNPEKNVYHFEQDHPERLCDDRELKTPEIHATNDYYGQASVLKRYAGLPGWYSLKVVLEHAPVVQDDMWEPDRNALLPVNLSCTESRARHMQKVSGKPSFAIGFGFLYAARLVDAWFGPPKPPDQRTGTVVFPFKSTHHIQTHFDHADYAQRLTELPAPMRPITICLYWKDYLNGVHREYEQFGHQVVTAGHMFHSDFLLRIYDICRQFRHAASNEFGTSLMLAVASGCSFSYISSGEITCHMPQQYKRDFVGDMPGFQRIREESWRLFSGMHFQVTSEQRRFVDGLLGTRCVRSPRQLRRLLLQAELRDKLWRLTRSKDPPLVQLLPACSRRFLQRVGEIPRRLRDAVRGTPGSCTVSGRN